MKNHHGSNIEIITSRIIRDLVWPLCQWGLFISNLPMGCFCYLRVSKCETRRIHVNGWYFQKALARLHWPSLFIAQQISVSGLLHKDSRLGEGSVKHFGCHFNQSTTREWITKEAASKSIFTSRTMAFHHFTTPPKWTLLVLFIQVHTIHLCKSGSLSGKAQTKVCCKEVKWMVD